MKKGQILSLDFLVATAMAILAIGLVFQFSELQVYDVKDRQLFSETKRVAETAGNLLVGNPLITCKLRDNANTKTISYLPNCVNISAAGGITKERLGIPSTFKCFVSGLTATGCEATPPNPSAVKNFYSVKRKIATSAGDLSKSVYDNCIKSGCINLAPVDVTITAWK